MNKKVKKIMSLVVTFILTLGIVRLPVYAQSTLPKITGVSLTSDGILSWDVVSGADSYWIGLNGSSVSNGNNTTFDLHDTSQINENTPEICTLVIEAYNSSSDEYVARYNCRIKYSSATDTFDLLPIKECSVKFYTDKNTLYQEQTVEEGALAQEIDTPEDKECYIFSGWEYEDGTPYAFGNVITDDTNLYTIWTPTHDLEKVEAKPATETQTGNKEYYVCAKCGKLFLEDSTNEVSLADVTIPALGTKPNNPTTPDVPAALDKPDNPTTPDVPATPDIPSFNPVTDEEGCFAEYQGFKFYIDDDENITCRTAADGKPVINDFKCDGTYTYYFQFDGTAMKDRLTYHPDGDHVIYFDANGHEVFNDFANVKKTIAGDEVDDYCFFNVFGYMYVDVVTYDKTGTVLYYANAYGVLERGKWFQFSDNVTWADGREGTEFIGGYGCANADGTLLVNTQTTDWEGKSCYLQGNGVALY